MLPAVCDEIDLLFSKRLQLMNKVISYSYAKKTFFTVWRFIASIKYARLRRRNESRPKLVGRFSFCNSIPTGFCQKKLKKRFLEFFFGGEFSISQAMVARELKKHHLKARQKLCKKWFIMKLWAMIISGVIANLRFFKP